MKLAQVQVAVRAILRGHGLAALIVTQVAVSGPALLQVGHVDVRKYHPVRVQRLCCRAVADFQKIHRTHSVWKTLDALLTYAVQARRNFRGPRPLCGKQVLAHCALFHVLAGVGGALQVPVLHLQMVLLEGATSRHPGPR